MLARTPLPYSEFLDDMRICAGITRRHAKSFSAGIRLFPLERRWATWALYGFVRLPDDIVDVEYANDIEGGRKALQEWITEWKFVLAGGETNDPVFRATRWLLKEYPEIKLEWLDTFLDKMLQDTDTDRYQKYSDLEEYMYGSATVVGYAMAVICGAKGDWID